MRTAAAAGLTILAASGLPSQQIPKFVALPSEGQQVIAIEQARLGTDSHGDVPIVVTTERSRLTLFWWDGGASRWRSWSRRHETPTGIAANARSVISAPWSKRVGLATGGNRVFVVYKRNPVDASGGRIAGADGHQMYVDVFEWDDRNGILRTPTDLGVGPIRLPLSELGHTDPGAELSAHFDPVAGLVVLMQSVHETTSIAWKPGDPFIVIPFDIGWERGRPPPGFATPGIRPGEESRSRTGTQRSGRAPSIQSQIRGDVLSVVSAHTELVLLRAATVTSLGSGASWVQMTVDSGGYALDSKLDNGVLHVVYRRGPYAVTGTSEAGAGDKRIPINEALQYESLQYRVVDPAAMSIDPLRTAVLPGGDHPQLLRINPFAITVDRPIAGNLVIRRNEQFEWQSGSEVTRTAKYWIHRKSGAAEWVMRRLFAFDARFRTRSSLLSPLPPEIHELQNPSTTRYSSVTAPRPVFLADANVPFEKLAKDVRLSLLMQVLRGDDLQFAPRGFLGVVAFAFPTTDARAVAFAVLDHSRGQIDLQDWADADEDGDGVADAEQTGPTSNADERRRLIDDDDVKPAGGENRQFKPLERRWRFERYPVSNTIGASLIAEPNGSMPSFYSYTDGDGGLRVIVSATSSPPTVVGDPKQVAVPIGGVVTTATRIDVVAEDWKDAGLPWYRDIRPPNNPLHSLAGAGRRDPGSLASGYHVAADTYIYLAGYYLGNTASDSARLFLNPSKNQCLEATVAAIPERRAQTEVRLATAALGVLQAGFRLTPPQPYTSDLVTLDARESLGDFAPTSWQWSIEGPLVNLSDDERLGPMVPLSAAAASSRALPSRPFERGEYRVTLTVGDAGGTSAFSAAAEGTVGSRPGTPREVQIRRTDAGIRLTWQSATDFDGQPPEYYQVYRADNGGARNPIGRSMTVSFNDGSMDCNDSSIPCVHTYVYSVAAVRGGQEGPMSAPTMLQTRDHGNSVRDLSLARTGATVVVTWQPQILPPGATEAYYNVLRRSATNANYATLTAIATDARRFDDMSAEFGHRYEYVVAPYFVLGGVTYEGTWSAVAVAAPWSSAVPRGVRAVESGNVVDVQWSAPELASVSRYRVYRGCDGDAGVAPITPTTGIAALTFQDPAPVGGRRCAYMVASINAGSSTARFVDSITVTNLWDPLWDLFEGASDSDFNWAVVDGTMEAGAYRLTFDRANDPTARSVTLSNGVNYSWNVHERNSINIETLSAWPFAYRFGDGVVQFRSRMTAKSDRIRVYNVAVAGLVEVESVEATVDLTRDYTVGPSMADLRNDPREDAMMLRFDANAGKRLASSLTAKPVGLASLSVPDVHVELEVTLLGRALVNIAILIVFAGAFALLSTFDALRQTIVQLTVTGTLAAILAFVNFTLEPTLELFAEGEVRGAVMDNGEDLMDSPLLSLNGEAISEALARKVVASPPISAVPDPLGRERYRDQFWQMAVVQPGRTAFWVSY